MIAALFALSLFQPAPASKLPAGAVLRLGPAAFHHGAVWAWWAPDRPLIVSPDRTRVAVRLPPPGDPSGPSGGVAEFDARSGLLLTRHDAEAPLAYSPDGHTLAVIGRADEGGGGTTIFLDTRTGLERGRTPAWDSLELVFAAFAGPRYFVWSDNNEELTRVYDLAAGAEAYTLPRPGRGGPGSHAVSPDGRFLAAFEQGEMSDGTTLAVYEVPTGRLVSRTPAPDHSGWGRIAFAPGGASLVAEEDRQFARYAVPGGELLGHLDKPSPADETGRAGWDLAVGDDAVYLLRPGVGGALEAFDVVTELRAAFPLPSPMGVSGQPGAGDRYAAATGARFGVWDLRTGRPRHQPAAIHAPVVGVALLADGRAVTLESDAFRAHDRDGHQLDLRANAARTWDAAGRQVGLVETPPAEANCGPALAPGGSHVWYSAGAGRARLADLATGRSRRAPASPDGAVPVFGPGARSLAYPGKALSLWDGATLWELWAGTPDSALAGATTFGPGDRLYAFGSGDDIWEWDAASGKRLRPLKGHADFAFWQHTEFLANSPTDDPKPGHQGYASALAVTPDGRRLVSADFGSVRLWDLELGQECELFDREPGRGRHLAWDRDVLAISPDGGTLAAPGRCGHCERIDLWNVRTSELYASLRGHAASVTALGFSADGGRLISGSTDGVAYVWEVPQRPAADPAAPSPDRPFADLASADAPAAYRALAAWSAAPDAAVAEARKLSPDSGRLRLRAVDLLEGVNTPPARALLAVWAKTDPAGALGRACAAALARTAARSP